MKKIILIIICIYISINLAVSARPQNLVQKKYTKEIYFDPSTDSYKFTQDDNNIELKNQKIIYVKIRKEELDLLRREAFISKNILDRLSDLEKLFRGFRLSIENINDTINIVKKILNITDTPKPEENKDENKVELPSGMILSPGFIDFKAKFYDPTGNFGSLGIKALDFDIFYNKNLFQLDHIEGDGVYGNQFKFISLPQSSSTLKDRIQLPLSDILLKEVSFQVYFVPRNVNLAKAGDTSEVEVKNYKKPIKDPNGENVSTVIYELGLNSPDFIKITKK